MLTTKKSNGGVLRPLTVALLTALLAGCTPSGPKALLQGERLIHDGKYAEAIDRLKLAVQLLPENGQAWNHLGIALHSAGQKKEASSAYRAALRRNVSLTAVHYNLGVLSLDQNDLPAAVSELTTYTVLQRDSIEGWLKLATAQLRARQLDGAERSFQTALRLKPGLAEALNGLGIVSSQRRHVREAVTFFSSALKVQPNYAPALLNLAVVTQPFDRSGSLRHYRNYLALHPTAPNAQAVRDLVQQIESEPALGSPPSFTNKASLVSAPMTPTNTVAVRSAPLAPSTNAATSNGPPVAVTSNLPPPTNTPPTRVVPAVRTPATSLKGAEQLVLAQAPPKAGEPPVRGPAAPAHREPPTPKPQETNPARELTTTPVAEPGPGTRTSAEGRTPSRDIEPDVDSRPDNGPRGNANRSAPAEEKPSIAQRMNPATWFRTKNRPAPITTPLDPDSRPGSRPATERILAKSENGTATKTPSGTFASLPAPQKQPATPAVPRYAYLSPTKPPAGDRIGAGQVLARGVSAHAQRDLSTALNAYREAVRLDASLFEAQYNLGLAAYELKEWPLSLSSYETALSINSTSINARFNFALALERAGYSLDAVAEFEKVLAQNPKETRAHFSMAKIYAEDLKQTGFAARHYRQLLELEPQHPQAAAIRQWLVAN
ncbi:MAG: tetratricopeptide repeat protein, partial [Verrucomicrobiales bacterium]|nr:tetratricopeptide repeat protein [Verrucomicrobiales bacterium]